MCTPHFVIFSKNQRQKSVALTFTIIYLQQNIQTIYNILQPILNTRWTAHLHHGRPRPVYNLPVLQNQFQAS